jgi:hypothetical protein
MNPRAPLDPSLLEKLSAFLDGKLEGAEKAGLEERLRGDAGLRAQLAELRLVRDSLRALPALKTPRPLTLSRTQAGLPARRPVSFSARGFAWASALIAVAFAVVTSLDIFSRIKIESSLAAMPASAPMVAQENAAQSATQALDKSAGPGEAQPQATGEPSSTPETPLGFGCGECGSTPTEAPRPVQTATPSLQPPLGGGCPDCELATAEPQRAFEITDNANNPREGNAPALTFETLAPYLEGFLFLSAVVLAGLAVVFRRRR